MKSVKILFASKYSLCFMMKIIIDNELKPYELMVVGGMLLSTW